VVNDAETTTHIEEAATLSVVYDAKKQLTEFVTQSVVNDVETTTHTEEDVTQSVVYNAETTTQNY
jgi:hypothetical protein